MNQTPEALMSRLAGCVRHRSGIHLDYHDLKVLVEFLVGLNGELATQRALAEKWKATAEALQQKGISS